MFKVYFWFLLSVVLVRSKSSSSVFLQGDQMIISVTGATGFIGKRLVQKLQAG